MIDITFLGTSGSAPAKNRFLPSVALRYEGEILLFDCGEGTQMQFINYSLNINKVTAIFITHMHGDHVIGVAGLVRTIALNNRTKPLYIFVPAGEEKNLSALLTFDRASIGYPILVKPVKAGTIYHGKGFSVRAFRLNHLVSTYGFVFREDSKLHFDRKKCAALGIRGEMFSKLEKTGSISANGKKVKLAEVSTRQPGKTVVYATDTRPTASTVRAAGRADLLIHESTYTEQFKEFAVKRKHSTAAEAAAIAKKANAKRLILFHMSVRYKDDVLILNEAKKIFRGVQVAYDGMKVSI